MKKTSQIRRMKIKSIYIHIPFCKNICFYCDFPKIIYVDSMVDQYISRLKKEILNANIFFDNIETIYVGGGTPTSLSYKQLQELLEIIKPFSKSVKEYTFETNPETLNEDKIILLKKYGVNRISIGVESTNNTILKNIGRNHTFEDVINCVNLLRKHGIDNYNFDLILGLPHVSDKILKKDIKNLVLLYPKHISCYSLTVNPNTVFFNKGIKEVNDEVSFHQYQIAENILKKHKFIHYEVSNWALTSYESKHNLTYWKNEPYYGFGLGAAGYIDNIRYKNTKSINKYFNNKDLIAEKEILNVEDMIFYEVMLGLRTKLGLNLVNFKEKYGFDFCFKYKDEIKFLIKEKYLKKQKNILIPTFKGMMNLDFVILKIFEKD